jgi:hypothetical protein
LIDILVVYTPAARDGAGGEEGIATLIDAAVAEANTAYEQSGVDVHLQLVRREEIDYLESASLALDLDRLKAKTDGALDEVHLLRDRYQADVVCLIVESTSGAAGLGYLMTSPASGFQSFAFSVIQRRFATGVYALAHEVGHNLGCAHDRDNAPVAGAYPYAYGNRFSVEQETFRTIMAYSPGTLTGVFSSPTLLFRGVPTGVPEGSPGAADNVRTINNTAHIIAGFRGPRPSNDDFADRILLSGVSVEAGASSRLATKELDEPNHAGVTGGKSVWWSWRAPFSGPVTISTVGSDFDSVLAVYTGKTLGELSPIAANDDALDFGPTNVTSAVTFEAVADATYQIAVDGFSEASGGIVLRINASEPPASPLVLSLVEIVEGDFHLRVTGEAGQRITVETSANLSDWEVVETATLDAGFYDFFDRQAAQSSQKFYRVSPIP